LKRYKALAVKPFLDTREKYDYFIIQLNYINVFRMASEVLNLKRFHSLIAHRSHRVIVPAISA
ncbi:hypothetical protein, partial [Rhizobium sp. Pop5]|uniref:hypothetical protein n=1 Tax=Rhizobium sp. Pop5 TaxID=1223565 RepID=UPI001969A939